MLIKLLQLFTIIMVGLLAGLGLAHALERPAKMLFEPALYIALQKSLYVRWGPPHFGGLLEPLSIAATGALAFLVRRQRRQCLCTGVALGVLLLAFPVVFFWLVAPANRAFAAMTPTVVAGDWNDVRYSWEMGHGIRFGLQLVALTLLTWPLVYHQPAPPESNLQPGKTN